MAGRNRARVYGFTRVSRRVGEAGGVLHTRLREAMQESLEEARDEMRDRIAGDTGGKPQWVAKWKNPPWGNAHNGRTGSVGGRIASGNMIDKVTFEMSADTKYRVRGRVGWLGRLGKDRYVIAQDQGFKHAITGEQVKGMMILRSIGEFADNAFERRAEVIARDVAQFNF